MERSKRLKAIVSLVPEGASAADIGTDHGYVPIDLIRSGKISRAVAMDVRRGPLERARMHIIGNGLGDRIETRLSDGLCALSPGEVEIAVISGLGGPLMIRILEDGRAVTETLRALVLQPQSEIARVREYLVTHGWRIVQEDMVEEDGKFYQLMLVRHERDCPGEAPVYEEWEYLYGKELLKNRHPVLSRYLLREKEIRESILRQLLMRRESESAKERMGEVMREQALIEQALAFFL